MKSLKSQLTALSLTAFLLASAAPQAFAWGKKRNQGANAQPEMPANAPYVKSAVDNYCKDLSKEVDSTGTFIGVREKAREMVDSVSTRDGKLTILKGFSYAQLQAMGQYQAQKIRSGQVLDSIKGKRTYLLDPAKLYDGANAGTQVALRRVLEVITATESATDRIVILPKEVMDILGSESSSVLQAMIQIGRNKNLVLSLDGDTFTSLEKTPGFLDSITVVEAAKVAEADALVILKKKVLPLERKSGIPIPEETLKQALQLAAKHAIGKNQAETAFSWIKSAYTLYENDYKNSEFLDRLEGHIEKLRIVRAALGNKFDPASKDEASKLSTQLAEANEKLIKLRDDIKAASDMIEKYKEATSRLALNQQKKTEASRYPKEDLTPYYNEAAAITSEMEALGTELHKRGFATELEPQFVHRVVARLTGKDLSRIAQGSFERFQNFETEMRKNLIAQVEAISAVGNALRRAATEMQDPTRPIGSFLFLGETGVGKTEFAKALAEFLFDDPNALIRVDMNDYQEKYTASRLTGSAPGYVGYEEGGYLTNEISRRGGFAVVLLDEVEKAHESLMNPLMTLTDEGYLTDGKGKKHYCRNCVVIMTSNLPQEDLLKKWRPEHINRLDKIVKFHSLEAPHLREILEKFERKFIDRAGLTKRNIKFRLDNSAKDALTKLGYRPGFGARPMKREFENYVADLLAEAVIRVQMHLDKAGQKEQVMLEKGTTLIASVRRSKETNRDEFALTLRYDVSEEDVKLGKKSIPDEDWGGVTLSIPKHIQDELEADREAAKKAEEKAAARKKVVEEAKAKGEEPPPEEPVVAPKSPAMPAFAGICSKGLGGKGAGKATK